MNRTYADARYETTPVEIDTVGGLSFIELYRERRGERVLISRVTYWDAVGQFSMETWNGNIPLDIIEDLIRETKEQIRI